MIAIIAGTGTLPLEACTRLRATGAPFFVAALFPQDNEVALQEVVGSPTLVVPQHSFKVGAILKLLKAHHTTQVLFVGKVDKRLLLKKLSLDFITLKLLARLAAKTDRDIMESLVTFLGEHGIEVISQAHALQPLLVPPGVLCGTATPALQKNIALGLEVATRISYADIGQTVVMKDEMIIAIEAIEGTDECIARGVSLAHGNVVVCKAARHDQNKKFDLPTLGPATLAALQPGDVAALAWQSGQTLIVDKDTFIAHATQRGITLVSV